MQHRLIEELKTLQEKLDLMVSKVASMHALARKAFQFNDKNLAMDVIKFDQSVNQLDEEINEYALSILATQSPVAVDLRTIISAIRVATDVERIGDYAKATCNFVVNGHPVYEVLKSIILKMSDIFNVMYEAAYQAYRSNDVKKAYEVAAWDKQIDALVKDAFAQLPQAIKEKDQLANAMYMFNVIRVQERAGDHTKNICEAVVLKVKGKKIDLG